MVALFTGAIAATTGVACGHTHAVAVADTAARDGTADHATPPHDDHAPADHRPAVVPGDKNQAPPKDELPLTASPAAQLKPGAMAAIQQQLVRAGALPSAQTTGQLDAPTRKALVWYQQGHDLPATGALDDATVKKLGLKPSDVFRTSRD